MGGGKEIKIRGILHGIECTVWWTVVLTFTIIQDFKITLYSVTILNPTDNLHVFHTEISRFHSSRKMKL
jgi:hypothetical protein